MAPAERIIIEGMATVSKATLISQIETLAQQAGRKIIDEFLSVHGFKREIQYFDERLVGCFEEEFSHRGLYGFRLTKGGITAIAYVGKSEGGRRLRQHLCNTNKNGTPLVRTWTKYREIRKAITDGFKVDLCLYTDANFAKASLSSVEVAAQQIALQDFKIKLKGRSPWIRRI